VHILDQGNGIYVNHVRRMPNLVTCHDLLAIRSALGELPYWATGRSGRVYQQAIVRGLRRAHTIVCDSSATRRDAARLLRQSPDRLRVVPLGLFAQWTPLPGADSPDACRQAGIDSRTPYFLHVGNSSPYKNRLGAVRLFEALRAEDETAKLVLAGKALSDAERAACASMTDRQSIVELTDPSGPDLAWLYSNARALLVTRSCRSGLLSS